MRDETVQQFYDQLAENYHLLYPDWKAATTEQAHALGALIRHECGSDPQAVLDSACGIGTQAIGLAALGHHVIATDLSPIAVARAAREAHLRHLPLLTTAADLRALPLRSESVDVVICADNALPHLLTTDDLRAALADMRRVLKPGGLLMITTRPYDAIRAHHPRSTPPQVADTPNGKAITFQLWNWHDDGERYDLELFQLIPHSGTWSTQVYRTTYWALTQSQITAVVTSQGFHETAWHPPEDTGFFQPVLTARIPDHKPNEGSHPIRTV